MKQTNRTRNPGFTLAELLVSVSIIALISSTTVAGFANVLRRARDVKRLADMEAINTALDAFYSDNGHYPGWDDGIPTCGQFIGIGHTNATCNQTPNPSPLVSIDTLLAPYMGDVPQDPLHDPADNNWLNPPEYYYTYDPSHNIANVGNCSSVIASAVVFGFFQSETNNANLERDTCNGGDMQLDTADFNRALYPASP